MILQIGHTALVLAICMRLVASRAGSRVSVTAILVPFVGIGKHFPAIFGSFQCKGLGGFSGDYGYSYSGLGSFDRLQFPAQKSMVHAVSFWTVLGN